MTLHNGTQQCDITHHHVTPPNNATGLDLIERDRTMRLDMTPRYKTMRLDRTIRYVTLRLDMTSSSAQDIATTRDPAGWNVTLRHNVTGLNRT